MRDRSALNERGAKAPRKNATSAAPLMGEGGGHCGVWPNRMYFPFDLGACSFFFFLSGGLGLLLSFSPYPPKKRDKRKNKRKRKTQTNKLFDPPRPPAPATPPRQTRTPSSTPISSISSISQAIGVSSL